MHPALLSVLFRYGHVVSFPRLPEYGITVLRMGLTNMLSVASTQVDYSGEVMGPSIRAAPREQPAHKLETRSCPYLA